VNLFHHHVEFYTLFIGQTPKDDVPLTILREHPIAFREAHEFLDNHAFNRSLHLSAIKLNGQVDRAPRS